jgi:hypothetical protein
VRTTRSAIALARGGPRALPAAGAVLALGVLLAAGGGGLLAAALVVAVRGERVRAEHAARGGRSEAGEARRR